MILYGKPVTTTYQVLKMIHLMLLFPPPAGLSRTEIRYRCSPIVSPSMATMKVPLSPMWRWPRKLLLLAGPRSISSTRKTKARKPKRTRRRSVCTCWQESIQRRHSLLFKKPELPQEREKNICPYFCTSNLKNWNVASLSQYTLKRKFRTTFSPYYLNM